MKRRFLSILFIASVFLAMAALSVSAAEVLEKTGYADMFSLSGASERFVLLDSDEEGYFVITQKLYGTHLYDANDQSKFDAGNPDNMAHWLNNGFLTEGNNGQKLPDKIIEHLVERDWYVEESNSNSIYSEAYNVRAKVALLSSTEFDKYISVFGYGDDTSQPYWFLRSSSPTSTNVNGAVMVSYSEKYLKTTGKNFRYYGVRPVFYLDKDFFKEVKLNLSDVYLGDNIKKVIRENHNKSDLQQLYTSDELETVFDSPLKPVASNVMVKGFPAVGSTLTATYSFYSPEGDADAGSVIRWVKSKNKNVGYRAIAGAKGESYTLTEEDIGYYVKAEVIPKTKNLLGFAVSSSTPLSVIFPDYKPVASNVYITGSNYVGARLVLNYNYSDGNYDKERGTQVVWERSKDGESYTKIENADTVNYIVQKEDIGCVIRGGVTVKNEMSAGELVYTAPTHLIYQKPACENLKISAGGEYVQASYTYKSEAAEGSSIMWWEVSDTAEGAYQKISASADKKLLITPALSGKYVRFAVSPCDNAGNIGDAAYSGTLKTGGNAAQFAFGGEGETYEINAAASIYAAGNIAPVLLSFDLICENTDSISITSDGYSVITTKTEKGIKCTFILKDGSFADGSTEIANITGNAVIENAVAGIYDSTGAALTGSCSLTLERR